MDNGRREEAGGLYLFMNTMKTTFIRSISASAVLFFALALTINPVFAVVLNNDPQDPATLRAMNFTRQGITNTQWFTSVNGSQNEVISFAIYYHNTSSETAQNVRITLNPQSTSVGVNHSFNATVRASNAPTVSGAASVNISSAQSMAFVPGSVVWRPNQTVAGSQTLPYGQNGSEIFTSSGLRIGDIAPGWSTQGSVVLHFKISGAQSTQAPTVYLSANPTSINQGSFSTLSWNSTNAGSCFASNGWSGQKSLSGSEQVNPSYTTSYTITCTNSQGQSATQSVTVFVNQQQQDLPTVSITASPTSVSQGQSTVLTWTSSNATSCSASFSWWGTKPLSGSEVVVPVNVSGSNIYRIMCSNSFGSRSDEINVDVYQAQNLSVSLTASQTSVNAGNPVTLYWSSTNANSCFATNGWSGTKTFSGNEIVYPQTTTTYTITCQGSSNQQRYESVTITVNQQTPTVSITANPTQIYQGGSSVLVWNSNNTNSCYATGAWSGSKSTSGSQTAYPSVTSTYTIVCTGSAGLQTQSSVTVSVIPTTTPPPPTQIFNAACVPDSSVVRVGQRVEFFAGTSDGARPLYYRWSGAVNGSSESVSTTFNSTGTKTAYLTITDATGKKASANCSAKVLAAVVTSATPKPKPVPPPAQPPCTYYCIPVIMQGGVMYPAYPNMPQGQAPEQWQMSPTWQVPPGQIDPSSGFGANTAKNNGSEKSTLASILLTDDGAPRSGIMFLFYLFLLSILALIIFAIYSMIVRSRKPMI
ncbi:MAG: hypothetical protein HYT37_03115 [Candidatus Sungbacteria bacterium]|nr:hypothetical protein [Candidatus Sungbacteria bacterium]